LFNVLLLCFKVNRKKCPLCDMTCIDKNDLSKHILYRHTNIKAHSCPHCQYSWVVFCYLILLSIKNVIVVRKLTFLYSNRLALKLITIYKSTSTQFTANASTINVIYVNTRQKIWTQSDDTWSNVIWYVANFSKKEIKFLKNVKFNFKFIEQRRFSGIQRWSAI